MGYFLMQTVGTALVAYFIQYTILREVQQIVFMGQWSNNSPIIYPPWGLAESTPLC